MTDPFTYIAFHITITIRKVVDIGRHLLYGPYEGIRSAEGVQHETSRDWGALLRSGNIHVGLILCRKLKSNDKRKYVLGGLHKVSEAQSQNALRLEPDSLSSFALRP
jgi:hypothetical protein